MAAVVQHITFNEFLPMVLGKDVMERYGLLLQKEVCYLTSFNFSTALKAPSFRAMANFTIQAWIPRFQYRSLRLRSVSDIHLFLVQLNAGASVISMSVSYYPNNLWFELINYIFLQVLED